MFDLEGYERKLCLKCIRDIAQVNINILIAAIENSIETVILFLIKFKYFYINVNLSFIEDKCNSGTFLKFFKLENIYQLNINIPNYNKVYVRYLYTLLLIDGCVE